MSPASNSSSQAAPAVQLPEVFAIGFSGHRKLADEAMCREAIHLLLTEQKAMPHRIVCAVSSAAAGGDLLFAESCIALDIPLRILLPFSKEEFQKDFDAPAWARAEQVMHSALSVEVVGTDDARTERYYECGLDTVEQTQLLVALWNGQPAQGLGGTAEIVEFAQQMSIPVAWIHSETGIVQTLAGKGVHATAHDSELKFLNHLPAAGTRAADDSPLAIAQAWLAKLDANAVQLAPQFRRLAAVPIVCTALAAFVSGAAMRTHATPLWVGAGAVLGLIASLLPTALRLGKRQAMWVRIRTAAEVSRSVLALWETPARYQVVGPEILPELSGMILSLNFLKSQTRRDKNEEVSTFRERYLKDRLLDQKNYFFSQSTKAAEKGRRYRLVSKVCVASAIFMSVWMFACKYLKTSDEVAGGSWLPLVTAALFQIAIIAGALLVVNDCDRRQRRYQEIHDSLADWEVELRAFRTWLPVTQVVSKIERALLVELLEWRSLLQNMKMPRN